MTQVGVGSKTGDLKAADEPVEACNIVVVGAGIAGLACAQRLQQAGYSVIVVEKSRGVGGRLATRRTHETRVDHGTCYLSPKGDVLRGWLQRLQAQGVVQVWTDQVYGLSAAGELQPPSERTPRYVAADGMSAIARSLAADLEIRFNQRAIALAHPAEPGSSGPRWQLTLEATQPDPAKPHQTQLTASALVMTVPTPQAIDLLAPLVPEVLSEATLQPLRGVQFAPCIAVMAGYNSDFGDQWQAHYPGVKAITPHHPDLAWIGFDSSKRPQPSPPVFVVQSTADFARRHLEASDLEAVGHSLLQMLEHQLISDLASPEWIQVHRWRYAFPTQPLPDRYWSALPDGATTAMAPLICAGDWCGGMRVESALLSGLAAAEALNQQLGQRALGEFFL
jgi:renalase